jgi:RimJ/RimL family protein N-acetyltransferase
MMVRFKTPADRKAWRRFVALVPDEAGHRPGSQLDPADLTTDYHRYDGPYMIAEVEGEIVGAVFIVPPDQVMGYHQDHLMEFHVDVLPGWRRQGIGTALVEGLVEWAHLKGDVRKMEAACLGWNEPVIEMLKGAGFREEGRSDRSWMVRLDGGGTEYDDVVHMGRWIGK